MTFPRPANRGIATLIIHHSITVLILILFVSLGTWSYLTFRITAFFAPVDRAEIDAQITPPTEIAQHQRISFAIDVFIHLYDRPPARLEELTELNLLLPSDLYYPGKTLRWDYERNANGFVLRRHASADDDIDGSLPEEINQEDT